MKTKHLFLFLFATILSLVGFTPKAYADEKDIKIGDLYYDLIESEDSRYAEIKSHFFWIGYIERTFGSEYDAEEIVIPSEVRYQGKTYIVKKIGNKAFQYCYQLKHIEIPNTVTDIESKAFANSVSLKVEDLKIPTSVEYIARDAFDYTAMIKDESNWVDGCFYIGDCLIKADTDIKGKLSVKAGTRLIAYKAFVDKSWGTDEPCLGLTEVVLPNTIAEINACAFNGCENLTAINIPPLVKEIKENTFNKCYELRSITFSKNIQTIGPSAFAECNALQDIYCSSEVNYNDDRTNHSFRGLDFSKITVHTPSRYRSFYQNKWKGFAFDFQPFEQDGIYYDMNGRNRTATILREKEGKDNYAALTGVVTIPKNVMDELDKFKITDMEEDAFANAPIARITIESEIVSVSKHAFANATKLTDAVLPKTVASIEDGAFEGCTALEYIPALTNTQKEFLPNLDRIGEAAFKGCTKLPKLWLSSVTSVGKEAFRGCTALTEITIGTQVEEIGQAAFKACTKLEKVTNLADKPQTFPDKLFDDIDKSQFIIYVHRTSYEAFKAADGWKDYNIQIIPEEVQYFAVYLKADDKFGTVSGAGLYKEGTVVTVTATPKEGYKFVRWSDGETKASYSFKLTANKWLYAVFEENVVHYYYDLNLQSGDETLGTVSGGGTHIEEGTVVDITATPKSGCEFQYWTDSKGTYWGKIAQWTVSADETLTAHFRVKPDYDEYLVYVLGERVTSSNANDILGDGVWSYDRATHTLSTMKDATYKKENVEFIEDWETKLGDLTVRVNHQITVEVTSTDETMRTAMLSATNGMKIIGAKNQGIWLTVHNMRPIQMSKTLTLENHVRLSVTLDNTTEFGKTNFDKIMWLTGTPALRVNSAWAQFYAFNNGKVSNVTDAKLELVNAEAAGSMDDTYMEIHDLTPVYDVTYQTEEAMNMCYVSGMGSFYEGEQVTLRALPATSYEFVSWSNDVTDNPYTFIMPAHDVLIDPVVIGEEIDPDGAIVYAEGQWLRGYVVNENDESVYNGEWFPNGTKITLKAVGKNGFVFAKWSDGNTDNPRYITIEAGKHIDLQAEFVYPEYFTVTFLDWDNEVLKEEKVFVGEDAQEPEQPYRQGYTFTGWDKDFTNVTADLTVKAQFEINTFTVRFFDMEGVQIGADQQIEYGNAATAPDAPKMEGYVFIGWDKSFNYVESDLDVYALYELERFKVELIVGEHGSVVADIEDLDAVPSGETIMLVALPEEYYEVENWSIDGEGDTRTLVVTSDTTVSVTFVKKQFEVTFIGFEGAVIDVVKVPAGEAATAPEPPIVEGYHFVEWDTPFNEIWENTTVTAIYEADAVNQPQNLKVVLTEIDGDTKIDFSWDVLEGAAGYAVGLGYGEQAQTLSAPTNSLSFLLSAIVAKYQIQPGTYTIRWFVAGVDADGNPIGDWAEGEPFEVTVKKNEQGIEDIRVEDNQTRKVMMDGVLYILRGDKIYTIQGAEVK